MRPREAAVMPLPREEVTPPVTNTNFGTGWTSGVFSILRSGDGEGKAVQNDEAGSIASGVRRVGRNIDRVIAAAIVEVSIESQPAEARIAKLAVLEARVLDDRHQARPEEAETVAQSHRHREWGLVDGEISRRHVEPLAEVRRHVRVARERDRSVFTPEPAEHGACSTVLVDDETADDDVDARCHMTLQPVGGAGARDVPSIAPLGDDALEPVF